MQRLKFFVLLSLVVLLGGALDSSANSINVGVPDAELIARDTRDGASGITFIDLDSKVSGNGWITSWSIYAQKADYPANSEARQVAVLFIRDTGTNYLVVGKSPLETIASDGWEKKHIFTLATPIQVAKDDYLAFYYPFQGTDYDNWPAGGIPGGVIAFDWEKVSTGIVGHNVRWNGLWGNGKGLLNVGDQVAKGEDGWFNGGSEDEPDKGKRLYSINATGTTTLTPIPSAAWLLGSGLMALVGLRRRLKK